MNIDDKNAVVLCVFALICMISSLVYVPNVKGAESILHQSGRWYEQSIQDTHPLIALRDAIFASAYLNASREITSDSTLSKVSGVDINKYRSELAAHQLKLMRRVAKHDRRLTMQTGHTSLSQWL